MIRKTLIGGLLSAGLAMSLGARTWTSADGKNTFEGEFVSLEGEIVTVEKANGKTLRFKAIVLSDADQAFVRKAAAEKKARAEKESKLANAAVGKELSGKLVKLAESGRRLTKVKAENQKKPEYYLVYFAASW
ncbi:MAG: hypothetical protein AAF514_13670 [Verrucomicrobiota bacterium]